MEHSNAYMMREFDRTTQLALRGYINICKLHPNLNHLFRLHSKVKVVLIVNVAAYSVCITALPCGTMHRLFVSTNLLKINKDLLIELD